MIPNFSKFKHYARDSLSAFEIFNVTIAGKMVLDVGSGHEAGSGPLIWKEKGAIVTVCDPKIEGQIPGLEVFSGTVQQLSTAPEKENLRKSYDLVTIMGINSPAFPVSIREWREIIEASKLMIKDDGEILIGFTNSKAAGFFLGNMGTLDSPNTDQLVEILREITNKKVSVYNVERGTNNTNQFLQLQTNVILVSDREIDLQKEKREQEQKRREEERRLKNAARERKRKERDNKKRNR